VLYDGVVLSDPMAYLEERQNLLSKQRMEKSELENEMDMEHAAELDQLRQEVVKQGQQELEDGKAKLLEQLAGKGLKFKHCWESV
jgi:hypothetical protein